MKRLTAVILATMSLAGLIAAGCSASSAGKTACAGPEGKITVCLNGKAIDFSAEKNGPHLHDSVYAPVTPLAKALGLQVESNAEAKTVTLNGKAFTPVANDKVKGLHVHDGAVFVPVKEFAEAAGLKVEINLEKGTAGIAK